MDYEYDPVKNASNLAKHGVPLSAAEYFEWETAIVREDDRYQYDEQRFEATGMVDDRLYVMVFCLRGDVIRVISLRKANSREVRRYACHN